MRKKSQIPADSRDVITLTEAHKKQLKEVLDQMTNAKLQLADRFIEAVGLAQVSANAGETYRKKATDIARMYGIDPDDQAVNWEFDSKTFQFKRRKAPPALKAV